MTLKLYNWLRPTAAAVAVTLGALACGWSGASAATTSNHYLIVGGFGTAGISSIAVTDSGAMSLVPGSPFPSGQGSLGMALTPDGHYLYSAATGSRTLTGYKVQADGKLVRLAGVKHFRNPVVSAVLTPDGSHLFVTVGIANAQIRSYDVSSSGALTATGVSPTTVGANSYSELAISPDGRYLVATSYHRTGAVVMYAIENGSRLKRVASAAAGALPAQPVFTPNGRYLYVTNEGGGTLSGYAVDSNGSLTPTAGSPYPTGGLNPKGAVITADSGRLYVPNGISGTIAGFQIGSDGALTALPDSPYSSPFTARLVLGPSATQLFAIQGILLPAADASVSSDIINANGSLSPSANPPLDSGLFWVDGSDGVMTP